MSTAILYVGIDLGNEHHAICVVDDVGKVLKERTVKNDFGAFEALQSLIGEVDAASVHVAVEDKNNAMVDVLMAHRFRVFTINPKQVDRFRERSNVAGAKDDRRDARVQALTLRSDAELYRAVELATDDVVALQSGSASLQLLDAEARSLANQLRACVLRYFPTLLTLCPGADRPWFWGLLSLLTSTGWSKTRRSRNCSRSIASGSSQRIAFSTSSEKDAAFPRRELRKQGLRRRRFSSSGLCSSSDSETPSLPSEHVCLQGCRERRSSRVTSTSLARRPVLDRKTPRRSQHEGFRRYEAGALAFFAP